MNFRTVNDFNRYQLQQAIQRHLCVQARDLCNVLCDKLYNWRPDPEQAARLEHALGRARARLARREQVRT